jgi:hypothetical protein
VAFIETHASEHRGVIISSSACGTRELLRAPTACYPSSFLFIFRRIFGIEKKELGDCQLSVEDVPCDLPPHGFHRSLQLKLLCTRHHKKIAFR